MVEPLKRAKEEREKVRELINEVLERIPRKEGKRRFLYLLLATGDFIKALCLTISEGHLKAPEGWRKEIVLKYLNLPQYTHPISCVFDEVAQELYNRL